MDLQFKRVSLQIIPQIIQALQSDLPDSLIHCQLLQMYTKCAQVVPERDIRLFLPGGVVDKYGTHLLFVPNHRYGVNFHSGADYDPKLLKKMILGVQDIDWSLAPVFGPVHDRFYHIILDIIETEGLTMIPPLDPTDNLMIDLETALNLDVSIVEGFELRPITVADAEFIDSKWPYRNSASLKFIEDTIKTGGGFGLFDKETNEMACWALHSLVGGVGMLQTAPRFRRRGFASIVSKAVAKGIAQKGMIPQVQIKLGIPYSLELFTSIGFKQTHIEHWCRFGLVET